MTRPRRTADSERRLPFRVPLVDLDAEFAQIEDDVMLAIQHVIRHGQFILGPEVQTFERRFAEYVGGEYCVGVGSGTDALVLTLQAFGVSSGDEVVVPVNAFAATALAVVAVGATPRFVDCDEETLLLDMTLMERALSPATKAIIPVHLYGQVVDVAPLREFGVPILEDAAQAHGAQRDGLTAGTLGDAACFSFYPSKNLGAYGDAGAVVTSSLEIRDRLRQLRDYGQSRKHTHDLPGRNSRLDSLQAAVLSVKLKHLDEWNRRRQAAARFYDNGLRAPGLQLPGGVYHLYVIRDRKRDDLARRLAEVGIGTGIHYPTPLHLQPCFRELGYAPGDFPVAERITREVLSLPMSPFLTPRQLAYVVDQVNRLAEPV